MLRDAAASLFVSYHSVDDVPHRVNPRLLRGIGADDEFAEIGIEHLLHIRGIIAQTFLRCAGGLVRAYGKSAKLGIAVSNASKSALDAADIVTVSNEQHAIREVISALECGRYSL